MFPFKARKFLTSLLRCTEVKAPHLTPMCLLDQVRWQCHARKLFNMT